MGAVWLERAPTQNKLILITEIITGTAKKKKTVHTSSLQMNTRLYSLTQRILSLCIDWLYVFGSWQEDRARSRERGIIHNGTGDSRGNSWEQGHELKERSRGARAGLKRSWRAERVGEKAEFEVRGGGTEARGRAGSGAAFSLTYISASQNQHSCQQAVEVGIHPHTHTQKQDYWPPHTQTHRHSCTEICNKTTRCSWYKNLCPCYRIQKQIFTVQLHDTLTCSAACKHCANLLCLLL